VALSRAGALRLGQGAVLAVAAYFAVWGGEYSVMDEVRLTRREAATRERLARTRAEVDSLRAQAKRLESDDATLERIARERFGMIAEGELLYRFVEVDSAPPSPAGP
jgi:cell division protein FtsB